MYVHNLYLQQLESLNNKKFSNKYKDLLVANILTTVDNKSISNICLFNFLSVYSHQNTDEISKQAFLPIAVKIGEKLFSIYI